MKTNKIWKYTKIFAPCLLLAAGCFFGGRKLEQDNLVRAMAQEESVNLIAVVNLDAGIEKEHEVIHYANKIIAFPGENFVSASLEEARTGIGDGRFAAYIVVPSDFSPSVDSINGTPFPSILKYQLNSRLKKEVKELVVEDIYQFHMDLNTKITYLYLSAILTEFYKVQDSAAMLMENDQKDLKRLQEVSAEALIETMKFPEMERIPNDIKPADVQAALAGNKGAVDKMSKEYTAYVDQGREEFSAVKDGSGAMSAASKELLDRANESDPTIDSEGESIIKDGILELDKVVDTYNTKQASKKMETGKNILTLMESEHQGQQNYVNEELRKANEEVEKELQEFSSASNGMVQDYIDEELKNIQKENNRAVKAGLIEFQADMQSYLNASLTNMLDNLTFRHETEVLEQLPEVRKAVAEQTQEILRQAVETAYENYLNDQLTPQIDAAIEAVGALEGQISSAEQVAAIISMLQELGEPIPNPIEEQTEITNDEGIQFSTLPSEDEAWQISLSNGASTLPDMVETGIFLKKAVPGNQVEKDEETQIWIQISASTCALPQIGITLLPLEEGVEMDSVDKIEKLHTLSKKDIKDTIDQKVIAKIQKENERERGILQTKVAALSEEMETYESALKGFDPYKYLTKSVLDSGVMELNTNLLEAETGLHEKSIEYQTLVSNVYTATDKNISSLEEEVNQVNAGTLGKVTAKVENLKQLREQLNDTNISVLNDFASKLKYTRLGTLPYKEMYEFLIHPVWLQK